MACRDMRQKPRGNGRKGGMAWRITSPVPSKRSAKEFRLPSARTVS